MLELYNTMSRQTELFTPLGSPIRMFTCGPSIYSAPHIGNYRTFIWEDVLQRYLGYLGHRVERVINLTDIEDKAIDEAVGKNVPVGELTGGNAERFFEEAARLRIELPQRIPRSSTSVEQSAHLIARLLEKGYAYRHEGDIFFDPLKFKDFGKLFRLDMSRWPKTKKRFKQDTYTGRRWNLGDFILWHGCGDGDEVCWDTEIGRGRPSWNIQDPAMISQTLGYSLDIFCGGIDNLYRHHDYNIAVMESVSGVELARYWLHGEHVLVEGKKMSKSIGNIVYPGDMIERGFSWEQIRFYLLSKQRRKRLNLNLDAAAEKGAKLNAFRETVHDLVSGGGAGKTRENQVVEGLIDSLKVCFEEAMNNDLDTPAAFAGLMEATGRLHDIHKSGGLGEEHRRRIEERLRKADSVLQVIF
ncbi:MAG: class I tRNA ligase family protein [Syntrophobacteraceae bacterium]